MYSLDELKKQNLEISQLCDVLTVLMEKATLQDNPFVAELMERFKEKVWMHLVFEDKTIYSALLNSDDEKIRQVANTFHESSKAIKHRFSVFVRHWCATSMTAEEYSTLCKESLEILGLIKDRIEYENTHMFPLVT